MSTRIGTRAKFIPDGRGNSQHDHSRMYFGDGWRAIGLYQRGHRLRRHEGTKASYKPNQAEPVYRQRTDGQAYSSSIIFSLGYYFARLKDGVAASGVLHRTQQPLRAGQVDASWQCSRATTLASGTACLFFPFCTFLLGLPPFDRVGCSTCPSPRSSTVDVLDYLLRTCMRVRECACAVPYPPTS